MFYLKISLYGITFVLLFKMFVFRGIFSSVCKPFARTDIFIACLNCPYMKQFNLNYTKFRDYKCKMCCYFNHQNIDKIAKKVIIYLLSSMLLHTIPSYHFNHVTMIKILFYIYIPHYSKILPIIVQCELELLK